MKNLQIVQITASREWEVTYNQLFHVCPEEADKLTVTPKGFSVWDLYFLEDLLQAANNSQGLLLDVGWYPHADPSGSFRMIVVPLRPGKPGRHIRWDWDAPLSDMRTRSLSDLLENIHRVMNT